MDRPGTLAEDQPLADGSAIGGLYGCDQHAVRPGRRGEDHLRGFSREQFHAGGRHFRLPFGETEVVCSARSCDDVEADRLPAVGHVVHRHQHDAVGFGCGERIGPGDARGLRKLDGVALAGFGREDESAASFVLGGKIDHGVAMRIDHLPNQIRRLLCGGARLHVDPARQPNDQIASFGIDRQIDALEQDRDRLRDRLEHAAIGHCQGKCPVAVLDPGRQREGDRAIPRRVDYGFASEGALAIDHGGCRHLRSGGQAALGALDVERGPDGVAGSEAIAKKDNLPLEAHRESALTSNARLAGGKPLAGKLTTAAYCPPAASAGTSQANPATLS